jgi:hypothetical protein
MQRHYAEALHNNSLGSARHDGRQEFAKTKIRSVKRLTNTTAIAARSHTARAFSNGISFARHQADLEWID